MVSRRFGAFGRATANADDAGAGRFEIRGRHRHRSTRCGSPRTSGLSKDFRSNAACPFGPWLHPREGYQRAVAGRTPGARSRMSRPRVRA